jgi:glycine/D-amino acid oxidase-like deaminating enzyme
MDRHFDFVVVGRGMMGAAAARHLAADGRLRSARRPEENPPTGRTMTASSPATTTAAASPARSTRMRTGRCSPIGRSRGTARSRRRAASPSTARPAACISGPAGGGFVNSVEAVAKRHGLDAPLLDRAELRARFPWFDLPETSAGVFEAKGAGYVDPRKLVAAQIVCVEKAGGVCILEDVVSVTDAGEWCDRDAEVGRT